MELLLDRLYTLTMQIERDGLTEEHAADMDLLNLEMKECRAKQLAVSKALSNRSYHEVAATC